MPEPSERGEERVARLISGDARAAGDRLVIAETERRRAAL